MTTVTITRATWRDTWVLWKVMRACFGREAYDPFSMFFMVIWPGELTLKAVTHNQIAGFISSGRAVGQDWVWIVALGVHPIFRRQGIATQLLAKCEAQTKHACVRLTVRAGNANAIALYRKAGYAEIGRVEGYYFDGEDGIEMEKCNAARDRNVIKGRFL